MSKEKRKVLLPLLFLLFLCFYLPSIAAQIGTTELPFKVEKVTEIAYTFKSDGNVVEEFLFAVKLVNKDDANVRALLDALEKDCSAEYANMVNRVIEKLDAMMKDANGENKEMLLAATKNLEITIKNAECKFSTDRDKNTGTWFRKKEWTMEELKEYGELEKKLGGVSTTISIEKKDDLFSVKIPRPPSDANTAEIDKLKIRIDGRLSKLMPGTYKVEGDFYVFVRPQKLWASTIVLEYRPNIAKPSPTATPRRTPTPSGTAGATPVPSETPGNGTQSISIFGQNIPLSPENLLYIALGVIALIGLIIIAAFIHARGKAETKKPEKVLPSAVPEKKVESRPHEVVDLKSDVIGVAGMKASTSGEPEVVVETKRAVARQEAGVKTRDATELTKETATLESTRYIQRQKVEDENVVIKPLAEQESIFEEKEQEEAAAEQESFSEADLKTIERALSALEPVKSKYRPEQLKKVMLEMGYKPNVANHIIKKLYKG